MDIFFRPIKGFPGYRVSRDGQVQSRWNRRGRRGGMTDTWLPLKPIRSRWDHLSVNLHRDGEKTPRFVHHLVLEAFVGLRAPGLICCHWDGDPANNHLENLRWDTYKSNCDDMLRHGTRRRGATASRAKLRDDDVWEIRRLSNEGVLTRNLAERYRVGTANIRAIVKGLTWKHLL
jgi:HNH endonuclease